MELRTTFLVLVSIMGCSVWNNTEEQLKGSWQAVSLTEGKDTFAYDLSQVRLKFMDDLKYSFQGNLHNQEAGKYNVLGKMLYTTDTLPVVPKEKVVEILKMENDS